MEEILLSTRQNRAVDNLVQSLKDCESATKDLQLERTTVADPQALFTAVIEKIESTRFRRSENADNFLCPDFGKAIRKI